MIGRADIEGSKSNVAMNAWLPQAAYPRGNFSDTSSFKFRRSKGSIGHAFTSDSPCPYRFEAARSTPGKVPEGTLPIRPPAGTRRPALAAGAARAVHRQPTGSGPGPPCPPLAANPFPEVTDPFCRLPLPTLFHRPQVCSPWRPDAVMSTTGREWHSVLRIFKGRRGRTGHHATCGALPAAGPYLRAEPFPGWAVRLLNGKDNSSRGPRRRLRTPLTFPSTTTSRFGNFNPIPFRSSRETRYRTGFPRLLGSTNPCASAVHMEPFP
ncbi:unnamed protein product, partial [Prunus brigantina]